MTLTGGDCFRRSRQKFINWRDGIGGASSGNSAEREPGIQNGRWVGKWSRCKTCRLVKITRLKDERRVKTSGKTLHGDRNSNAHHYFQISQLDLTYWLVRQHWANVVCFGLNTIVEILAKTFEARIGFSFVPITGSRKESLIHLILDLDK